MHDSLTSHSITRFDGNTACPAQDHLVIEEPLEIRLDYTAGQARVQKSISVTLRTPGFDRELGIGFLFSEGVVNHPDEIDEVVFCKKNVVRIRLNKGVEVNLKSLERHFYTTSSCGVCGKTSLEAVGVRLPHRLPKNAPVFSAQEIHRLPDLLREGQTVFDHTGALHAAALFDNALALLGLQEDVGRHNAVDKLIGGQFVERKLPLSSHLLFVSGRAGFELVQKSARAGVAVFAAIGAPSSLSVELAQSIGMTLLGFVRNGRFNIYSGAWRIQ